jgi:drug/metabolite transporter (DMT)-like permease
MNFLISMNTHLKGSLFIVLATFFFSTQTVLIRYIQTNLWTLLAYIHLIMIVILLSIPLFKKDKSLYFIPKPYWILVLAAITSLINVFFAFHAIRITSYANAMFTHYMAPIFAFIIAIIFLKEKFEWQSLGAIILSIVGLYFLVNGVSFNSQDFQGIVFGLISGIAYGINITALKAILKTNKVYNLLLWSTMIGLIVFGPFLRPISLPDLGMIAWIAIISGVFGVFFWFSGVQLVKAQHAGIIAYTELLFILLWAYLFFKELITPLIWIGGLLIVASGIFIITEEAKRKSLPKIKSLAEATKPLQEAAKKSGLSKKNVFDTKNKN